MSIIKRERREKPEELNGRQRYRLLTGTDWSFPRVPGFEHDVEERASWERHRDELMEFWLQDPEEWEKANPDRDQWVEPVPGGPGTRPWAWWEYDAPEPRRVYPGRPIGEEREPQIDYLRRLDLLTHVERGIEAAKARRDRVEPSPS